MKESKKFFGNNRLNRGYGKVANAEQSDTKLIRKKYNHVLPPIDLIEEYEEMRPGTLDQLMKMSEREQKHRQDLELASIEHKTKLAKFGMMVAVIFVLFITIGTLALVWSGDNVMAAAFCFSSYAAMVVTSYFSRSADGPQKFLRANKSKFASARKASRHYRDKK